MIAQQLYVGVQINIAACAGFTSLAGIATTTATTGAVTVAAAVTTTTDAGGRITAGPVSFSVSDTRTTMTMISMTNPITTGSGRLMGPVAGHGRRHGGAAVMRSINRSTRKRAGF